MLSVTENLNDFISYNFQAVNAEDLQLVSAFEGLYFDQVIFFDEPLYLYALAETFEKTSEVSERLFAVENDVITLKNFVFNASADDPEMRSLYSDFLAQEQKFFADYHGLIEDALPGFSNLIGQLSYMFLPAVTSVSDKLLVSMSDAANDGFGYWKALESSLLLPSDVTSQTLSVSLKTVVYGTTVGTLQLNDALDIVGEIGELYSDVAFLFAQPNADSAWSAADDLIDVADSLVSKYTTFFQDLAGTPYELLSPASFVVQAVDGLTDLIDVMRTGHNLNAAIESGALSELSADLATAALAYRYSQVAATAYDTISGLGQSLKNVFPAVAGVFSAVDTMFGALVGGYQGYLKGEWANVYSGQLILLGKENGGIGIDDLVTDYKADIARLLAAADELSGGEWSNGALPSANPSLAPSAQNGTEYNDTLIGNSGADTITGNAGNDRLEGRSGRDSLDGGSGNDYIAGGSGNDILIGGGGTDVILGGFGNDTLDGIGTLDGGAGNDIIFSTFGGATGALDGGDGSDTLNLDFTTAARLHIIGGQGWSHSLPHGTSSFRIPYITAGSSSASIEEFLTAAEAGLDYVRYGAEYSWRVNYSLGMWRTAYGTRDIDIENDFEIMNITGSTADDLIFFTGRIGRYDGNDGTGDQFVADWSRHAEAINWQLDPTLDQTPIADVTITGVERVHLRLTDQDDNVSADGNLYGNEGNDTLSGNGLLEGGSGNDVLSGAGTLTGGEGHDSLTGSGVLSGGAGDDTLTGTGNLNGGDGDDVLAQTSAGGTLAGGAGDDAVSAVFNGTTLSVSGGDDADSLDLTFTTAARLRAISGQDWSHSLDWPSNRDPVAYLTSVASASQIEGFLEAAEAGVDYLRYGAQHSSVVQYSLGMWRTIYGSYDLALSNDFEIVKMTGSSADDLVFFTGRAGRYDGSDGTGDLFVADWSGQSATINWQLDPAQEATPVSGVSVLGFERLHLRLTDSDDTVTANGNLYGNAGHDTLTGNGVLDGGVGNDVLTGDGTLSGGDGNDSLTGSGTLAGGEGQDTLTGTGTLDGGEGDDILTGTGTLNGGGGNDIVSHTSAGGVASGGDGDDTVSAIFSGTKLYLTGDDGTDTLDLAFSVEARLRLIGGDGWNFGDTSLGNRDHVTFITAGSSNAVLEQMLTAAEAGTNFVTYGREYSQHVTFWPTGGARYYHSSDLGIRNDFETTNITGSAGNDLILFTGQSGAYDGGGGTGDLLVADWSQQSANIHWQLDPAAEATPVAGVSVAGFERVHVRLGAGDDAVRTGDAHDFIDAGAGNDLLRGGGGNDILIGGAGFDAAVYAGLQSDFTVTQNADESVTVSGTQGIDTLSEIEVIVFAHSSATGRELQYVDLTGEMSRDVFTGIFQIDEAEKADVATNDVGYDNVTQSFNGVITSQFEVDVADVQSWETMETNFDAEGNRVSKSLVYDDGVIRTINFVGDKLSSMNTLDLDDSYLWTSYVDSFDENGSQSNRIWSYDDGRQATTTFTDGVRTKQVIRDLDDAYKWHESSSTFNSAGVITERAYTYDDGRSLVTDFEGGIKSHSVVIDLADSYIWTSYVDSFDENGSRSNRIWSYDDGRQTTTTFTDGVRTKQVIRDSDDAYKWHESSSTFNSAGVITERAYTYDDGRSLVTEFEGGIKSHSVVIDLDDSYIWTSYVDSFDENGSRSNRIWSYDDGRQIEMSFANGVRSSQTVRDLGEVFVWHEIGRNFDVNGVIAERSYAYDDDRSLVTYFNNGVKSRSVMTDTGDAFVWESYTDTFDSTGTKVSRIMSYDDGREMLTTYAEDLGFG